MVTTHSTSWLVISYFASLDGMAASQHMDDRLTWLEQRGIVPILVSSTCGKRRTGGIHLRLPAPAPSGLRFELRHALKRYKLGKVMYKLLGTVLLLPLLPFYLLEKLFINLDSEWSWFATVAPLGNLLCKRHKPVLVYSTGGPISAHIAAALISRWQGLPWIAEFQDPLLYEGLKRRKSALFMIAWAERFICTRASLVVFLTKNARDVTVQRVGQEFRSAVIYPGADPVSLSKVDHQRRTTCRFSHFGSLGGSRNLTHLVEGLKQLLSDRPELAKIIRFETYGTCDALSQTLIRSFPYESVIRYCGKLTRSETMKAMQESDVLVLLHNTDEFGATTIPFKTYEYLCTGRPILGLTYRNKELKTLLATNDCIAVEADAPEEIKKGLASLVDRWLTEGLPTRNSEMVHTLSSAAESLISEANLVLSTRSDIIHA